MKRYNITTSRTYTKNGEEKKQWNSVGTLVQFPATQEKSESFIMELHMFPGTKFSVFPQEDKSKLAPKPQEVSGIDYPTSEELGIDVDSIPF